MSEQELVAAARRVSNFVLKHGGSGDSIVLVDAILNPTTPAERAAVAVLSGDTRPEVLAPILDELAERFAGGPKKQFSEDDQYCGECPACRVPYHIVRPGKSRPSCECGDTCSVHRTPYEHVEESQHRYYGCRQCGPFGMSVADIQ